MAENKSPPYSISLFKTPNSTNPISIILIVVVLIAATEILIPRVVVIVLRRTPVAQEQSAVLCHTPK